MDTGKNQKRNRLIALSFASVLLLLVYGPLATWFVVADRLVYDFLASKLPNEPLHSAMIISIDPSKRSHDEILDQYGKVLVALTRTQVRRVILSKPPPLEVDESLPGWAAVMSGDVPVYVPTDHRFADVSGKGGFVSINPDDDGILRRSDLWARTGAVMSPSLALAIAFDNEEIAASARMSNAEDAVYLSSYDEVPRVDVDELLFGDLASTRLKGATVFVDHEPALIGAAAVLPSGQFVTHSEVSAALLANLETDTTIIAPSSVKAIEWLAPVLLAIVAVLFMPDRSRKGIALLMVVSVVALLILELLMLYGLRIRVDIGRPMLIFVGIGLLSLWLVGDPKRATKDAFKKGSDFLAAGRLEPAFAEFRRCNPSETLATVMYKLSIAFENKPSPNAPKPCSTG